MNIGVLIYWAGVVVSLYAAWLFSFRTYNVEGYYSAKHRGERLTLPHIVYILVFAAAFAPILNIVLSFAFFLAGVIGQDDIEVDSWLFRKPGDKKED